MALIVDMNFDDVRLARRLAAEGFGWEDIVVRLNWRISKDEAWTLVEFAHASSLKKEKGNHLHG